MWFLGLIIGAFVGSMGGISGAFLGSLIGLFAGIMLGRRPAVDDKWKRDVEDALKQLHRRLDALERGGAAAPAPERTAEAPPSPAPAQPPVEAAPVMDARVAAMYTATGNEPLPGAA